MYLIECTWLEVPDGSAEEAVWGCSCQWSEGDKRKPFWPRQVIVTLPLVIVMNVLVVMVEMMKTTYRLAGEFSCLQPAAGTLLTKCSRFLRFLQLFVCLIVCLLLLFVVCLSVCLFVCLFICLIVWFLLTKCLRFLRFFLSIFVVVGIVLVVNICKFHHFMARIIIIQYHSHIVDASRQELPKDFGILCDFDREDFETFQVLFTFIRCT